MIDSIAGAAIYDESSPTGLRWLIDASTRARKGSPAGSDFEGRYWRIRFRGAEDLVHRVIWRDQNGDIPQGLQIDHINGDGKDNRIANLRLVTVTGNQRNRRLPATNQTGVVGVRFCEKDNGYEAKWFVAKGKQKTKFFSCQRYGEASAKRMATDYRARQIAMLNDAGAGYTPLHGLKRVYG